MTVKPSIASIVPLLAGVGLASPACAAAADGGAVAWLPWLVLGAIIVFVIGIALRMIIAARFPAGYGRWAKRNRDKFAARNEAWDRDDEAFRK